ncbi:MAG: bacteriohemerythrin [Pseudomonadota bacterium]
MSYVVWCDMFSVGVPFIDHQHQWLINLLNRFHELFSQGKAAPVVEKVLTQLIRYADKHFHDEEQLMLSARYPDIEAHKKLHETLVIDIFKLQEDMQNKAFDAHALELFLNMWIVRHILVEDKKLQKYCVDFINFRA